MSYSIDEGIDDAVKTQRQLEAIKRRFPNARMGHNGRWEAEGALSQATAFQCEMGELVAYVEMEEGARVFDGFWLSQYGGVVLERWRQKDPAGYASLLEVLKARGS